MAIYNQNTKFSNEERYLKNLMMTTDNVKEANWAKNELSKLYESAVLSGQEKDWEEGSKNRTATDKAGRDKQNGLLSKGSTEVNGLAAEYRKGQKPGQHEMRDIYGTVTGVKRPFQEQENWDQGRNSREENFDIRKPGLNGGFDSLGREASANELTPDEQRLIETIFAAAEQVRQEKKAGNTQESSGLSSDNSSSGKTITGAMENDTGGKTGSGRGTASQISRAGQDIGVRATNLSQGNSVDYHNTTGDITIVTDEGYKTVLKKGKDYYIGSDNKAYYINNPSMAVKTFGGQDNDWQFSEDGTKLTNKSTGYMLEEGKDYYTGSDGIPYYYSDVRTSNTAKGTGVDYDPKGTISLRYTNGRKNDLKEGKQYYIGADGKAHYFSGPPSPNPDGMDEDDGDPLWLVDDIFEGWDEEDDEIPYAPYNDDDDDDWGDVLDDDEGLKTESTVMKSGNSYLSSGTGVDKKVADGLYYDSSDGSYTRVKNGHAYQVTYLDPRYGKIRREYKKLNPSDAISYSMDENGNITKTVNGSPYLIEVGESKYYRIANEYLAAEVGDKTGSVLRDDLINKIPGLNLNWTKDDEGNRIITITVDNEEAKEPLAVLEDKGNGYFEATNGIISCQKDEASGKMKVVDERQWSTDDRYIVYDRIKGGNYDDWFVSQGFNDLATDNKGHFGIDMYPVDEKGNKILNAEVKAVADGKIYYAGLGNDNGWHIVIESSINGKTYYQFYAHLQEDAVSELENKLTNGETIKVKAGDIIGLMGGSGTDGKKQYSDHLHFGIFTFNGKLPDDANPFGYYVKDRNERIPANEPQYYGSREGYNYTFYDPMLFLDSNGSILK